MKHRAYHEWLGIPIHRQSPGTSPPDHYLLLGIPQFETNIETIRNAFDQRRTLVRKLTHGEFESIGEEILSELEAARACLLNADLKRAYDRHLKHRDKEVSTPPPRRREWAIGSHADCDIVVRSDHVSRFHCRIIYQPHVLTIVDKSRNGTFVNQQRIEKDTPRQFHWSDLITLGREQRLILPPDIVSLLNPTGEVLFIGRSPQNDICLSDPSISTFHARLVQIADELVLEDLSSSNGTWMCEPDGKRLRLSRQSVFLSDCVEFGHHRLDVQSLVERRFTQ